MSHSRTCYYATLLFAASCVFCCLFSGRSTAQEYKKIDAVPIEEFFRYDKNLPFNIEKKQIRETALTVTYSIYYDSANNERVPAVLTIPKKEGPHPVILFMHGHGMKKDLGEMGDMMIGQKGYAMFGIDVQYRNERRRPGHDIISEYMYSSRDAFIQTVIDNMRGIDYLATVDEIDSDRIGVMGLSMGTFIGSVLFSLDDRISVGAFGVGGANWQKVGEKSFFGPLYRLKQSGKSIDEIFSAFSLVDPLNFVDKSKGRPVIMVNGRLDELVPAEAAVALYQGFGEPKNLVWFDGGHVPSMDTIMGLVDDMFDYFGRYLKPGPEKYHRGVAQADNTVPMIRDLQVLTPEVHQNDIVQMKVQARDEDHDLIMVKAWFECSEEVMQMYDDGKSGGDDEKGDAWFTGRTRLYEKADLGTCPVTVTSVDRWGEVSEELNAEFEVLSIEYPEGAHAPVITKVSVPDTVKIGDKVHFEIHAEDADGDLKQILVSVVEIGLTLAMPPMGGVIEQDFSIPEEIPTGKYHFTFQAKDASKMYSEIVEKEAEILPKDE